VFKFCSRGFFIFWLLLTLETVSNAISFPFSNSCRPSTIFSVFWSLGSVGRENPWGIAAKFMLLYFFSLKAYLIEISELFTISQLEEAFATWLLYSFLLCSRLMDLEREVVLTLLLISLLRFLLWL
jgi:hypothetical protein